MALTSKSKIAEQIQMMLSGGNVSQDFRWDIRFIILNVEQVFAQIMRFRYFQSKAEDSNDINGDLIYPLTLPVEVDEKTKRLYSDVPSGNIDLPNGVVIRHISKLEDQDYPFVPVSVNFGSLYRNRESSNLAGRIGFYVEGDKIFYLNMSKENKPDEVFVRVVLPLSAIDEDEEINIPSDIEGEIVMRVMALLNPPVPQDNTNDSKDLV